MKKTIKVFSLGIAIICVLLAFSSCELLAEIECYIYGHSIVIFSDKEPTCTENGLSMGESCERCGSVFKSIEVIKATGHKWVAADCTTPKHCETCGLNDGEALGHTEEIIPAIPSTCQQIGSTQGVRCSVCEEVLQEPVASEIGEHEWSLPDELGNITCTVCGAVANIITE